MKRERSGVHLLLGLLLMFSGSMGIIYQDNIFASVQATKSTGGIGTVSPQESLEILLPLIVSRSVEKIVDAMVHISADRAREIVKAIMNTKQHHLTRDDVLELIYGLASHYKERNDQYTLLDLILEYEDLQRGLPFLYDVAESSYPHMIPAIRVWALERQSQNPLFFKDAEKKAFSYAVKESADEELVHLAEKVRVTPEEATDLLWQAVLNNSDAAIIPILVKHRADINNNRKGFSPLMKAIDNRNFDLVKALVQAGANLNALYDPAVGNPLQRALGSRDIPIELYLRDQGARE